MTTRSNRPAIGWMTSWRCGCTYIGREHKHPTYCPYHAPGLTEHADRPTLQARTERLAYTEPIYAEPIVWGLLVEHLEAVAGA